MVNVPAQVISYQQLTVTQYHHNNAHVSRYTCSTHFNQNIRQY
jgi:hypothetical protein